MGSLEEMHVIIIGAGFCGAACAIVCREQGMKVTLFDQVPEFFPIGDSICFGSNTTRLFKRWGMFDRLDAISCKAKEMVIHNWDGEVIGHDPGVSQEVSEKKFRYPAIVGHRGDLHAIFIDECRLRGVDIRMGTQVTQYDVEKPSITLASGEEIKGDVVIASDGVKSLGREKVLGYFDKPVHSGYAVYRAFMDSAPMLDDPLCKKFVESGDQCHLWIGPDLHGIITTIRNGTQINAVLTHKDIGDVETGWTFPGKKEDVLALVKDWDPAFIRVWEKMENILDWKLVYRPCLDKWVTDSGLVAIAGDAAHPFLPTSTQGASQAIEDATTLALCLAKAGKGRVPLALRTYFLLRHQHAKKAQESGISTRDKWHNMHDKESKKMLKEFDIEKDVMDSYPFWNYDCEKVVEERWDEVSGMVEKGVQISRL